VGVAFSWINFINSKNNMLNQERSSLEKKDCYIRIDRQLLDQLSKLRLPIKSIGRGYHNMESYAEVIRRLIRTYGDELQKGNEEARK